MESKSLSAEKKRRSLSLSPPPSDPSRAMFSAVRSLSLLAIAVSLLPSLPSRITSIKKKEPFTLWVNKVGPYNNPQETYNYYILPFCRQSTNAAHKWGGLGEVLGGNELIESQIDIKFQQHVDKAVICPLELNADNVKQFKDAIENSYWFEFFMDKNSDNGKHVLYTHKNIMVKYNNDQIHWFSIFNSFMILMRTLRNDYAKYAREDDDLETLVGVTPASWKCSEEFFSNQIKNRDPLKLGFPNVRLLRLVTHLLLWDPEERLSVDEALQHPYFKHPPKS